MSSYSNYLHGHARTDSELVKWNSVIRPCMPFSIQSHFHTAIFILKLNDVWVSLFYFNVMYGRDLDISGNDLFLPSATRHDT